MNSHSIIPLTLALTAAIAGVARLHADPEVLMETRLPSGGTVTAVLDRDGRGDEEYQVFILRDGDRQRLPAMPEALDATQTAQWLIAPPELYSSPDGNWIFGAQKVCTGYCIGGLYRHVKGANYHPATKTRFDALAWRFFAKKERVSVEDLIISDSPAHLIDFVTIGNRYIGISLRGAILDIPEAKNVPRDPKHASGESGVYDWRCLFDLKKQAFRLTPGLDAQNKNAWERWLGGSPLWESDAAAAVESSAKRLLASFDQPTRSRFQQEQGVWKAELEKKKSDKSFDLPAALRVRAMELEVRLLESQRD